MILHNENVIKEFDTVKSRPLCFEGNARSFNCCISRSKSYYVSTIGKSVSKCKLSTKLVSVEGALEVYRVSRLGYCKLIACSDGSRESNFCFILRGLFSVYDLKRCVNANRCSSFRLSSLVARLNFYRNLLIFICCNYCIRRRCSTRDCCIISIPLIRYCSV